MYMIRKGQMDDNGYALTVSFIRWLLIIPPVQILFVALCRMEALTIGSN